MALRDKEYIVFCDESDKKGEFFSNFYGGVMVGSSHWDAVTARLAKSAEAAGITSEVKWSKVGPHELGPYSELLTTFFTEIQSGILKMRVMFRQNAQVPQGLSLEQRKNEYFLLYYQFLKHGFGFAHMPDHSPDGVTLRLYLDKLPNQNRESKEQFRGHIAALASTAHLRHKGLKIAPENITDVDSKRHLLLQCMDVVLGSIAFRLNDKHKAKPAGQFRRGKRTIVKEKLYKFIRERIKETTGKPHFNIGESTSPSSFPDGRWHAPYLHWKFRSKDHEFDSTRTKIHKRGKPRPT